MKKIFGILYMLWGLSACSTHQSAPISVNINLEENPAYQYQGEYAALYYSYIHIQSTVDQISINRVSINRGNCPISFWVYKNPNLKFGQEMKAVLRCDMEQVREVTVETDQGEFTFNF
jgi:hypothetical protein